MRREVNVTEAHSEAITEIARRHADIHRHLALLEDILRTMEGGAKSGTARGDSACTPGAAVLEELVGFFTQEVCDLLRLEEEVLFPPVGRDLNEIGGPVAALELEHEELRQMIREFAQAVLAWSQRESEHAGAADAVLSSARRLRELLRVHIEKEEAVLFRLIPKIFTRADRRRAAARLRAWSKRKAIMLVLLWGMSGGAGGEARAQERGGVTGGQSRAGSMERGFTVHGELRLRWEWRGGQLLGGGVRAGEKDGYVLTRVRIGVEARPTQWLRVLLQGQDAQAVGFRGEPDPPLVEDTFDLRQAMVEIFDRSRQGWGLRLGRQELRFGDERLLGAFDWGNTARSFDAVRFFYARPQYRVDLFAASVVIIRDGAFNTHRAGENLYGLYGSFQNVIPSGALEGYALWRTRPRVVGERGERADADVFTVGTRWAGTMSASLEYRLETAGQWGRWGKDVVRAWAMHAQLRYRIRPTGLSPRVLVEYNQASGDRDPQDGRRQTFDQLYPTNHDKYGIADVVGWQNMRNVRLGMELRLRPRITTQVDYHSFWLASPRDALYSAGGAPIARLRPIEGAVLPTHVGQEVDVDVRIALPYRVSLAAGYAHLFPGRFLTRAAPGASVSFAYTMLSYRF